MPVDFRQKTVTIPSGTGRRNLIDSVTFSSKVKSANVVLNGFKLDYVKNDHNINILEVDTDLVSTANNKVVFSVECNFADKNFDDPYKGYVNAMIIAEVE